MFCRPPNRPPKSRRRSRRNDLRHIAGPAAAWLMLCSCASYERWAAPQRAQQRTAESTAPAPVVVPTGLKYMVNRPVRTMRVRFRPNSRYLAQNVDVPTGLRLLVDNANAVLGTAIGARLQVDRIEPWSSDLDDKLDGSLEALRAQDSGDDVDFVVGLIGALPKETNNLQALGDLTPLGKHVVLRSAGLLGEQQAIDTAFSRLSDEQRARYAKQHRDHRALVTFLHAIGRCLGAVDERDPRSLMNQFYRPDEMTFGPGSIALMRAALEEPDRAHIARAQIAILERDDPGDWLEQDREHMLAYLQSIARWGPGPDGSGSSRPSAAPVATAAPASVPELPAELKGADRDRFVGAIRALKAGHVSNAYEMAKPLFPRYPNVYGVQDLRCQLATVRWLDKSELEAECAGITRQLGAPDAGARLR
jgi:hypothetical protein